MRWRLLEGLRRWVQSKCERDVILQSEKSPLTLESSTTDFKTSSQLAA
jgi:hypothetical protein